MKKFIFSILILSTILLTSCNKWLDVKPEDKVLEDEMFASQKGFLSALNGVYIELVSPSLYGSNLTSGNIDIMAQYYKIMGNNNHSHRLFANYNYTDETSKNVIENIWIKNYTLIYNINTIIKKCNEEYGILNDEIKKIIIGESYALRAMLHFDLLRLFGPIYISESSNLSIPYQTKTDFTIEPILSAHDVVEKITEDLEKALQYLDNDPVITNGATFMPDNDGNINLSYRQYRLNNIAVKGLFARVALWSENKTEAFKYATDVINLCHNSDPKLFPFVSYEQATSPVTPDRIFSTEVLFGLYNSKRVEIFNNFFSSSLSSNSVLTMLSERIETMFDDDNDFRKKFWRKENINSEEVNVFLKYSEIVSTNIQHNVMVKHMIPMIRLSEMYLIAAECATDLSEANMFINLLRAARNCININITESSKKDFITAEYLREFIGEGQMFFYYKRNRFQNLPNGGDSQISFNMNLSNYILPLPDSEVSQRN